MTASLVTRRVIAVPLLIATFLTACYDAHAAWQAALWLISDLVRGYRIVGALIWLAIHLAGLVVMGVIAVAAGKLGDFDI